MLKDFFSLKDLLDFSTINNAKIDEGRLVGPRLTFQEYYLSEFVVVVVETGNSHKQFVCLEMTTQKCRNLIKVNE